MSDVRYTSDHEWIRTDEDGNATIGITDFAQQKLGDLVFVDLPEVGTEVSRGDDVAVLESVKAAGEVKAPVSGTVIAVNEALADEPGIVNSEPTSGGWFYKLQVTDDSELNELMDEDAYGQYLADLE